MPDVNSRSPVLDIYGEAASTARINSMEIASAGPSIEADRDYLVDLSALRKTLVIGPGAEDFVRTQFAAVPNALFDCVQASDNRSLVHLHYRQYLVLDNEIEIEPLISDAAHEVPIDDGVLLRFDACECALLGPRQIDVLHEMSASSSSLLATDRWLATRIAHAEVGIRRVDVPSPHLRIVCSPADARFMFGVLKTIVEETGGTLTSFDAYMKFRASM